MVTLTTKPGFDWGRVAWGRPDSVRSAVCSYCFAAIGDDDMPLIMTNDEGWTVQFCDGCVEKWWTTR